MLQPLRRLPLLAWFVLFLSALSCQARSAVPIAAGPLTAGPIRYQFAIYYPAAPAKPPMAALRERLATANAPKLVDDLPDRPAASVLHARLETDVKKNYAPPSLDLLQRFGRGITREEAQALQGARQALILDFAHPASLSASAHRASLLLGEQVARDTHGLLWDEETREVFTPDEWHERRLKGWDGDTPEVPRHIVIHAYQGDKLVRAITLGMTKFGLPDLVVDEFSWSSNRPVSNLINLLAQAIAEGGAVGARGVYELDVRSIRHAAVRHAHVEGLGPKGTGVAALTLVKGTWEDGDPRNRLVEIRFDRAAGPDRHARQDNLLSALFGADDSVSQVKHTKELLDASKAAAARLPALRDAFARGLQPGEYILVKAPFAMPGGGNEWMWVEITAWDGDSITGLLKNDPANIPSLHAGQVVKVSQRKIFDYIRRDAAGREEGNETGRILQRQQDGRK